LALIGNDKRPIQIDKENPDKEAKKRNTNTKSSTGGLDAGKEGNRKFSVQSRSIKRQIILVGFLGFSNTFRKEKVFLRKRLAAVRTDRNKFP